MIPCSRPAACRRGFTLLEVLVACGILVVSLASIAAMIPAAASRLSEATATDRAAVLASLGMSDLQIRGLATPSLFASSTSQAGVLIGEGPPTIAAATVLASGYASPTALYSGTLSVTSGTFSRNSIPLLTLPATATLNARADATRGFFLEDDLQWAGTSSLPPPQNQFTGQGFRQFNRQLLWGAVLTPEPWGTASGSMTAVRASIAVFRKPSTAVAMTLRAAGPNIYATGTWPAAIQRTRLKPCSAVLAIPLSATLGQEPPQWLGIRSSWTSGTDSTQALGGLASGSAAAFVVFDRPPPPSMVVSGSLTVLTFDNLLSTDQKIVPIR